MPVPRDESQGKQQLWSRAGLSLQDKLCGCQGQNGGNGAQEWNEAQKTEFWTSDAELLHWLSVALIWL